MRKRDLGFSHIETMLAAGIVGFIALSAALYLSNIKKTFNRSGDVNQCQSALSSVLANLKGRGLMTGALYYSNSGTGPEFPTAFPNSGIPAAMRSSPFAGRLVDYNPAADPPVTLNLPVVMDGTMGTLTALYNSSPGTYCAAPNGGALPAMPVGRELLSPTSVEGLNQFAVSMRVRPFSIPAQAPFADGDCPQPLVPRPAASTEPPPPTTMVPRMFNIPAQYRADVGWQVTLRASYLDRNGGENGCQVEEKFQYPVDRTVATPPLTLSLSHIEPSPNYLTAPTGYKERPACSHNDGGSTGRFRLRLGFQGSATDRPALEPGSVVLCRDESQVVLNPPSWCQGAAGASMTTSSVPVWNPANSRWVPCDQVTACGIAPANRSFNMGSNYFGEFSYDLEYNASNIWSCDVRINAAAIDSAGNARFASSSNLHVYFQPAPCYSCIRKKRRGFFSRFLCFVAITVGVGQKGGCKGSSFYACQSVGGSRCTLMKTPTPDWMGQNPPPCPATSGTFSNGQGWSVPSASEGAVEMPIFNDEPNFVRCELHLQCENSQWMNILEPDEPDCVRAYTRNRIGVGPVCNIAYGLSEVVQMDPPAPDADGNYPYQEWYTIGDQSTLPSCETEY